VTGDGGASGSATPAGRVPQRCTLVLPSSDAFDSRSWRIATALTARGHEVTIVARRGDGQPATETHADGRRVVRVDVAAVDGLPRPLRAIVRRLRRDRTGPTWPSAAPGDAPGPGPAGDHSRAGSLAGRLRAGVGSAVRLAAIGLTVRSQRLASRPIAPPADLVHAMAYMGIPIGLDLARRDLAPAVYDARDIYVDAANVARLPVPARRLFAWVERRWARQASRVVTVNEPYAAVMEQRFGVPKPLIVMNCSHAPAGDPPRGRRFHDALALPPTTRVVLYQGGFSRDRGIEQLVEALPALPDDAVLVLLGYGVLRAELEARAASPESLGRLFVLPGVPPADLLEWVGSADVVAMPIQPSTLNHRLTTPNKLFEAMAAGVPVVASDLPGMAGIVRETGCGVLCDPTSPAAIAAAIRSILDGPADERAAYRQRGLTAVRERYNWDAQMAILLAEYGRLTGRPW
jgi:glycosyltransferase involved in cell wall biosynthesis